MEDKDPKKGDLEFATRMLLDGEIIRRASAPGVTYWLDDEQLVCSLDVDTPWQFQKEDLQAEDWEVVARDPKGRNLQSSMPPNGSIFYTEMGTDEPLVESPPIPKAAPLPTLTDSEVSGDDED